MSNVFQFPDRIGVRAMANPDADELFLGIPSSEVMDRVFEFNFEFLGVQEDNVIDHVEFFVDSDYPGKVLVDIEDMPHRPNIRGLYHVDLNCFVLRFISDKPLRHFV